MALPMSFKSAFDKLKGSVTPSDAHVFQDMTLEDVWKTAEEIQELQRKRKSLQNMGRIDPFLKGLEKYSKVIEVLCNGTPYLPWIWAPVKLMLQLASEHRSIFEKLLEAYEQIAEAMPQFDRLQTAFRDDQNFRIVLGLVYTDILEFHRRAYKFFRRRSWVTFFHSLWKDFDSRFIGILKSLARHQELLMKEVTYIDAVEARGSRSRLEEDLIRQEKERADLYLRASVAWLKVADERLDDELEQLGSRRQAGTCEWILKNPKFLNWKDDAHGEWVIWLKGIPGAGKTILSTYLIRSLQGEEAPMTAAYHICNRYTSGKNLLAEIFRSLAIQLLRANLELAPYVFDNYANRALPPAPMHLKRLLPEFLSTIPPVRIFIDGIDEYPEKDQIIIFQELLSLVKSSNGRCRILFSNREGERINRILRNKPTISLKDESADVNRDIEKYVAENLGELRDRFRDDDLLGKIQNKVVSKADGMFLWVRLIMQILKKCHSKQELRDAVKRLPDGLDEAYDRILTHVKEGLDEHNSAKAVRILEWIACSFRVMKIYEIQDGIVFHESNRLLNDDTKLTEDFVDLCKPLIEVGPNNTIDFVHLSAKEYVLSTRCGPFLHYNEAHYELAFSCITYMNTSIRFYERGVAEDELRLRVVKGFHGLHHYANEFWFQHLLQYAKCEEHVDDDHLDEPLEELREFYWKGQPGVASESLKLDDTTSADGIRSLLEPLKDNEQASKMGLDVLKFRTFMAQEKYAHKDPAAVKEQELKHDPTLFTAVSQRYQAIVQELIDSPPNTYLPSGITPQMLDRFKSVYQNSAFICRYRDCPRSSDGFKFSRDRDEHESRHAKPLRCAVPSCSSFLTGFRSKTGLLKHNKKCHPRPEDRELPEFEPRKVPEPVHVPAPPSPPPSHPLRVPTPPPAAEPAPAPPVEPPRSLSPSTEPEERQPVRREPPAPRKSRAKRGLPVHDCYVCKKVFTRAEGLRRHEAIHKAPQYICDKCPRAFFRADLLHRHMARHYSETQDETPKDVVTAQPVAPSGGEEKNDDVDVDDNDSVDDGDCSGDEDEDTGGSGGDEGVQQVGGMSVHSLLNG